MPNAAVARERPASMRRAVEQAKHDLKIDLPTVVPSVLHAMAPRRVACELPGGVVFRSFFGKNRSKRKRKKKICLAKEPTAMARNSRARSGHHAGFAPAPA
jgi:hypothetical protein